MDGWIKIYRQITECAIWDTDEPFSQRDAWIDLLLMANHRDKEILIGRRPCIVKAGQRYTSIRKLSSRWRWGIKKTESYLKLLKKLKMITIKGDTRGTLISIVNYSDFQFTDSGKGDTDDYTKERTEETQGRHEGRTNNNEKNEKNNIFSSDELNCRSPGRQGDVASVVNAWNEIPWVPDVQRISAESKRGKMLGARIKEYGTDKVLEAVSQVSRSEFLKDKSWFNFDWFVKPNNFPKILEGNFTGRAPDEAKASRFDELQDRWKAIKDLWGGDPPAAKDGRIFWDICTDGAVMDAGADVDYDTAMLRADYFLGAVSENEGGDLGTWLIQESQRSGLKRPS